MPLRFTFRQLEYLVAVGDAGTIALASQHLNVSSPSISAAISQLEAEFGIQLFVRHHAQGLTLTPGGRRLFNAAKQILDDASALIDLASDISDKPRGPISVGVLTTAAPMISASIRKSFEHHYPDASVSLHEGNQMDLFQMLGRAEIDVAITYDMEIPKDISFEEITSLPPYVMLPAGHAMADRTSLSLKDLENDPMILLDLPHSREYFLSMFQATNTRPNVTERTSDLSVARSLVANGFGFSLINMRSKSDLAPDGEKLVHLPLSDSIHPLVLGLATKQSEFRSSIVSAFFDHVRTRVQKDGVPGIARA